MGQIDHRPQHGAQEDFLVTPAQEVFFGGEAGGGKSWACLQDFLYDVDNPNANGILFRRSFPDLEDLIFKAKDHFGGFNPKYNEAKHLFTFPSGARFRFAHMNHVSNIFTHAGQEYTHEYWDELCHFPKLPYVYLMSRLRTTDSTIPTRIRATGNPDGEGVLWVKQRFVDKLKPYEIKWFKTVNDRDVETSPDDPEAISRQWIPTKRSENTALMKANPQYEAMLNQLPEKQKRAYKYGVWDTYDAEFQVIKTEWWQHALSGDVEFVPGIAAVGGDYAESGDRCAMASGRGNQIRKFKDFPGMTTPEFARKLWEEHMRYGKNQCLTGVDGVGPGVGVYHDLDEMGLGGRINACKYKDENFGAKYDKFALKLQFNNWRTQAWWQLREDMAAGEVDLHLLQEQDHYYDNIHLLQEEIFAHTYEVKNGVVHIISKNELRKEDSLGRSPDLADTLVIWNWMRKNKGVTTIPKNISSTDYRSHKFNYIVGGDRTEAHSWT